MNSRDFKEFKDKSVTQIFYLIFKTFEKKNSCSTLQSLDTLVIVLLDVNQPCSSSPCFSNSLPKNTSASSTDINNKILNCWSASVQSCSNFICKESSTSQVVHLPMTIDYPCPYFYRKLSEKDENSCYFLQPFRNTNCPINSLSNITTPRIYFCPT